MGIYSEYLNRNFNFPQLTAERKAQLRALSAKRGGRDVFVYAADLSKPQAPITLDYGDLLPINDQLAGLCNEFTSVGAETGGHS